MQYSRREGQSFYISPEQVNSTYLFKMTYSVIMTAKRKAGMSMADFKKHYEEQHIPLLYSIAGENFPLSHKRHYVQRDEEGQPSLIIPGKEADFDYDALVVMTFRDKDHFDGFVGMMYGPDVTKVREEDEAKFIEMSSLAAVHLEDVQESLGPENEKE
ncbi:EthD domain-containing protein [Xylariaceae sp. FL0255]|nr:EthD domain-containing protein [Xylariaceae sp. FL0255]